MNNTIIFGSAGFIGSHFKRKLQGLTRIIEFDLVNGSNQDVRKSIELEEVFGPDDLIINLAAIHRTPGHAEKEYFETNIRGAENVCAFAERHGINNIIFTSSIGSYGTSEEKKFEDSLPKPNFAYGSSKLSAEYIHLNWQAADAQNRKLLIIRPGVVFGLGENGNFTRLYNSLSKRAFLYPGRKDTLKGCIYVKDLVDLAIQINNSFERGVRLYNFSYEPSPSILEIVEGICRVAGLKPPKLVVNGTLLRMVAAILEKTGGPNLGFHPDRVRKLMISTNISGKRLLEDGFDMTFGLQKGLEDWFMDCDRKGLF
ncbi:MAG: NAD(P)-dependent oxidoreductase [Bacteroidales bacterium]|nr:NAD(P)-dependent oxidoreductase [Bacteroidales bacterium]